MHEYHPQPSTGNIFFSLPRHTETSNHVGSANISKQHFLSQSINSFNKPIWFLRGYWQGSVFLCFPPKFLVAMSAACNPNAHTRGPFFLRSHNVGPPTRSLRWRRSERRRPATSRPQGALWGSYPPLSGVFRPWEVVREGIGSCEGLLATKVVTSPKFSEFFWTKVIRRMFSGGGKPFSPPKLKNPQYKASSLIQGLPLKLEAKTQIQKSAPIFASIRAWLRIGTQNFWTYSITDKILCLRFQWFGCCQGGAERRPEWAGGGEGPGGAGAATPWKTHPEFKELLEILFIFWPTYQYFGFQRKLFKWEFSQTDTRFWASSLNPVFRFEILLHN